MFPWKPRANSGVRCLARDPYSPQWFRPRHSEWLVSWGRGGGPIRERRSCVEKRGLETLGEASPPTWDGPTEGISSSTNELWAICSSSSRSCYPNSSLSRNLMPTQPSPIKASAADRAREAPEARHELRGLINSAFSCVRACVRACVRVTH